jgi:DNA-binding NarL/FixJ family response regulator
MTSFRQRAIVIYGDSVLLEGIAESLHKRGNLTVMTVSPQIDSTYLADLHPDLVLVDASQIKLNQIEELTIAFPAEHVPPIIHLNMDSQKLTITTTQQFPAASFDDLERALEFIEKPIQLARRML